MNIAVQTNNGFTVVRPDITWERYNRDFYVPDFAGGLAWVPVAYAPVIRPGKFIQPKFAGRHLSRPAFGVLFYPGGADRSPEAFAQACCFNHSSHLPEPFPEGSVTGGPFSISINGAVVFRADDADLQIVVPALAEASKRVLLNTGDIFAAELGPRLPLDCGKGPFHFTGCFEGAAGKLLDFQVII